MTTTAETEQPPNGPLLFEPTPRQLEVWEFLRSREPSEGAALLGYGGAMGGGKTRTLVELAIETALAFPGTRILIGRLHYTDLSATTMREFFEHCPRELIVERRRSQPQSVSLRSEQQHGAASTIQFRQLRDWRGLGSEQYGAVLIDEAGEVPEEAARMLLTRLRHPAQPFRYFVAASNPWPGWFERWFVRRELPLAQLEDTDLRLGFIPARIRDNPHLPSHYEQLQRLLLPHDWVDRFVEGSFDSLLGLVYSNFDRQAHRWDGPLPPFVAYVGGIDFGGLAAHHHHTAAVVAGLTSAAAECGGGVLIRLGEFEDRGPEVMTRLAAWMQQWERRLRRRVRWRADRSQSAWIGQMRQSGFQINSSTAGPHTVIAGINLVQRRLNAEPGGARPQSYYTPEMRRFPERMFAYRWRPPSENEGQIPQPHKQDDDLMDADRYMHEQADSASAALVQVAQLRVRR